MLTMEKARQLLTETTTQEHLFLHAKNLMAAMGGLARHFGEDEAHWMAIGYLHDYDYEQYFCCESIYDCPDFSGRTWKCDML